MATNITQIYLFLKDRYIRFLLKLSLSIFVPHSTPHSRVSLTYPLDSHFVPHHARSHTLTLCNLIPVTLTYLISLLFLDLTILRLHCVFYSLDVKSLFSPQVLSMNCSLYLALPFSWNAHLLMFTSLSPWQLGLGFTTSDQSIWCCSTSQWLLMTLWFHKLSS